MKIIAIILSIISATLCSEIPKKLCMNCKHFIKHPRDIKYSKCALFKKLQEDDNIFINGIEYDIPIDYYHCSIARNYNHLCGKKGKKYEEN